MFICWVWAATHLPPLDVPWLVFPGVGLSGHLQKGAGVDGVSGEQAQKVYCNLLFLPVPASDKEREV